ncbi:PaaI family thioesterase [Burkholderia contaminans]|uniref:Phenylacetic acid degradation protein n=1 Tax=Burkholderia contaminans TaxID=488447 RepID=A0A6P3BQD8_9BURK|nr:PaaI family thioesterase [Burkholderia contaminans]VWD60863.1 phenylacetic acid degradation protein [Burkholderia contaminans]
MNPLSLSGLDLLRAAVSGDAPLASIAETIPMRPLDVELGYVKFSARADDRHLNPLGGVHGGFAATVLDSVTGCAVHSMLDAGVGYGTVDLHVKMLRPVPRDVDLVAEGRVIHLSRSLGVAEGTLKTADDKIVAHASATCFIQRPQ